MKNLSKLERFDHTLNDLESELTKLRGTSTAYMKLQELSTSYGLILDQFELNTSNLDQLAKTQIVRHEEIGKALEEINKSNADNYHELKLLNDKNGKELNFALEELRKENRQFYLDFEKVVRIKLDENKSDIKQLIEKEQTRIREAFETKIDQQTSTLVQHQEDTNKLVIISSLIVLLLLVGILVKLFS